MKTRFLDGLKKHGHKVKMDTDGGLKFSAGTPEKIKNTCRQNISQIIAELQYVAWMNAPIGNPKPDAASRIYADYPDHEMQRAEDAYCDMYDCAVNAGIPVWFWENDEPKPKTLHVFLKPQRIGGSYVFTPMIEDEKGLEVWI